MIQIIYPGGLQQVYHEEESWECCAATYVTGVPTAFFRMIM